MLTSSLSPSISAALHPSKEEIIVATQQTKDGKAIVSLSTYQFREPIPADRTQFINETLDAFLQCHSHLNSSRKSAESLRQRDRILLKTSKGYLSLLKASLLRAMTSENQHETNLFAKLHMLWGLAHLILIEPHLSQAPIQNILPALLDWLNAASSSLLNYSTISDIQQYPVPHQHPLYFQVIETAMCRAQTDVAIKLLQLHPAHTDEQSWVSLSILLLTNMPQPERAQDQTDNYYQNWLEWKRQIEFLRVDGNLLRYISSPSEADLAQMTRFIAILSGDKSVLKNVVKNEWIDLILAQCLYTRPVVALEDLDSLVQAAEIKDTLIDQLLKFLFLRKPLRLLKYATQLDWWFVTHLVDILIKSDLLTQDDFDADVLRSLSGDESEFTVASLGEYFMKGYGEFLYGQTLYLQALEYLRLAGKNGRLYISLIAEHVPITDSTFDKLVDFYREYGFESDLKVVYRRRAEMAFSDRDYLTSIVSFYKSGDIDSLKSVCDALFLSLVANDVPESQFSEIVGQMKQEGVDVHLPCVLFLVHYESFTSQTHVDVKAAAKNLALLFTSQSPKKFWPGLFKQVVAFLKKKQVLFSMQETFDLLLCLQEYVTSPDTEQLEFMSELRILLAQNLARSHRLRMLLRDEQVEVDNEMINKLESKGITTGTADYVIQSGNAIQQFRSSLIEPTFEALSNEPISLEPAYQIFDPEVSFPIGSVTCIAGASGSGKTRMVLSTMIKMLSEFPDLHAVYISNSMPTGVIKDIIRSTETNQPSHILSRMNLVSCYSPEDLIVALESLISAPEDQTELGLVVVDPLTPFLSVLYTSGGTGNAVITYIVFLLKKLASVKYCCVLVLLPIVDVLNKQTTNQIVKDRKSGEFKPALGKWFSRLLPQVMISADRPAGLDIKEGRLVD